MGATKPVQGETGVVSWVDTGCTQVWIDKTPTFF
ncbi:hypothetical protein CJA_2805 [Cellvibrio japonicus Ueda107]|uniref:Uncharacterized protein n=1 Tax=Cellvibrio japonicus (strain Ueda107) TaxID=498211 RepID=B3PBZ4_CELJU|nr:hypothetical protein CJA_2805 [Cellvibrio japonicus Ueda107]